MKDNERIREILVKICEDKNIGMFEATMFLAEKHELEVESILGMLDEYTLSDIKDDALSQNMVRDKSGFNSKVLPLEFF